MSAVVFTLCLPAVVATLSLSAYLPCPDTFHSLLDSVSPPHSVGQCLLAKFVVWLTQFSLESVDENGERRVTDEALEEMIFKIQSARDIQ